eukprot:s4587_g4.t1
MSWRRCLHLAAAGLLIWLTLGGVKRRIFITCPGCEEELASIAQEKQTKLSAAEALECLQRTEPPWLYAFGDSLSRGVFFDIISLLNGTENVTHPGSQNHLTAGRARVILRSTLNF